MSNKPKHFLLLKIVGVIGIATMIAGVVLSVKGFGDFESNNFMIGSFLAVAGMAAGFSGIMFGFSPEIAKARAKTTRYIQEENKEDLSAIATNPAEIMSDAVTTTASAVAEGIRKTMFCKHCGKTIDADSKFCSHCGGEQ